MDRPPIEILNAADQAVAREAYYPRDYDRSTIAVALLVVLKRPPLEPKLGREYALPKA